MITSRPLHVDDARGRELRSARLSAEAAERSAASFRALADPTRLQLAGCLLGGDELCVCDLSWICERPQNLVSHHMKLLKAAGLVSARREGKMTMYRLTAPGRALLQRAHAPHESAG
jgi:ArsR family transcriptional regulator, lead/cadmium/zinc/bismuth-responsive transcriptional repressor